MHFSTFLFKSYAFHIVKNLPIYREILAALCYFLRVFPTTSLRNICLYSYCTKFLQLLQEFNEFFANNIVDLQKVFLIQLSLYFCIIISLCVLFSMNDAVIII